MRRWLTAGIAAVCATTVPVVAAGRQTPAVAESVPASAPPPAAAAAYQFPSGVGVLFFYVRPDRAADFEAIAERLDDILSRATDPLRAKQAQGWHIFKSTETPKDAVVYLFFFDPAVVDADYDPMKLVAEGAPDQAADLYRRLRDDVIRVERMGLATIR
ncbi:MAG TPA: hypothetical protein VHD57_12785 [Vicinamibacterales bacterium]|jgi:hypothetical protein|nr:hypothetical protein [Vicinamibacterales bacterium]